MIWDSSEGNEKLDQEFCHQASEVFRFVHYIHFMRILDDINGTTGN